MRQNLSAAERTAIKHLQSLIRAVIETGHVPAPESDSDDDEARIGTRPVTVREALLQALSQVNGGSRAAGLQRVFSEFRGPELDADVAGYVEQLDTATAWDWGKLGRDLAALAPYLDGSVRDKAIEVGAQYFREAHVDALVALANPDHLTDEQVQRVFAVALEEARPHADMISSHSSLVWRLEAGQAQLVARLAPKLSETQLMQGLAKIRKGFGEAKVTALAAIAPRLQEPQRGQAIAEGFEEASRADRDFAEQMFRSLAPLIGPEQQARAIQAAESVYSPLARAHALCGLRLSFAPVVDLAPRILRALLYAILEDYDDENCSGFLAVVERELLPRSLLEVESLRAIADDLTEIATRWEWL